jgi:hypothetical protein
MQYGQTNVVHAARQRTFDRAFRDNPERFVNKPLIPPAKPIAAWINPPTPKPGSRTRIRNLALLKRSTRYVPPDRAVLGNRNPARRLRSPLCQ